MPFRNYEGYLNESGHQRNVSDALAIEHPLSVLIHGEPFMLTMQTPGSEEDLVRGILFSEGVYKSKTIHPEIRILERSELGYVSKVEVILQKDLMDVSQLNKRNLLSVASCGICGRTELFQPEAAASGSSSRELPSSQFIHQMMHDLSIQQTDFKETGGCHGAAIANKEGKLLVVREDIGRHNAVDKCIGNLLQKNALHLGHYLLVSGRVSYEIVVKCFTAGVPFLIAVSAPSSLAVDFAKELGVTLLAFTRETRFTRYS